MRWLKAQAIDSRLPNNTPTNMLPFLYEAGYAVDAFPQSVEEAELMRKAGLVPDYLVILKDGALWCIVYLCVLKDFFVYSLSTLLPMHKLLTLSPSHTLSLF